LPTAVCIGIRGHPLSAVHTGPALADAATRSLPASMLTIDKNTMAAHPPCPASGACSAPRSYAPCRALLTAPLRVGTQPGRAAARIPGGRNRACIRRGPAAGHRLGRVPRDRSCTRRRQPALWRRCRGLTGAAHPACICRVCTCCDSASALPVYATLSLDSLLMLSASRHSHSMCSRSYDTRQK